MEVAPACSAVTSLGTWAPGHLGTMAAVSLELGPCSHNCRSRRLLSYSENTESLYVSQFHMNRFLEEKDDRINLWEVKPLMILSQSTAFGNNQANSAHGYFLTDIIIVHDYRI